MRNVHKTTARERVAMATDDGEVYVHFDDEKCRLDALADRIAAALAQVCGHSDRNGLPFNDRDRELIANESYRLARAVIDRGKEE